MELQNLIFREINSNDFTNYINLMFEFTNYQYSINKEEFTNHIDNMNNSNNCKIIVIEYNNNIIGAGSIYKIKKLHNNPIGQIEDVIITDKYRKYGLGKQIINKLVDIGFNDYNCYKIILNCLEKNTGFYEKCNFIKSGIHFKFDNNK